MRSDHPTTMTEHENRTPAGIPAPEGGGGLVGDPPIPAAVPSPLRPATAVGEPLPPRSRRRRRWPWAVFLLLVVATAVASRWNLDSYAVQPGTAQSVQPFITVPADRSHRVRHPVLLTDVQIGRVTALTYPFYWLQGDTTLVPLGEVTGGTPASQLDAQGRLEMSQAEASAKTAALRHLGYQVTATPSGAVIFGTFPGTPAYRTLSVGDVVTAVDGVATPTAGDLTASLAGHHSGQTVSLTVRKGGTASPVRVPVTLKSTVVDVGGGRSATLDLGILPEDQVDYGYPFAVAINVTNIGGPSAGLAMTLGVIDALTAGSVTGGHTVAATGTIDGQGDVGDVGGVPQKTVAVENAGASIFLVPPQEYRKAMSKDRPGLKIYAVSTLDQALSVLASHGGTVPAPAAGASARAAAAG